MYEVIVEYADKSEDMIICVDEPEFDVGDGFIFVDCGQGQSLTLNIDSLLRVRVKYPLPTEVLAFKYSININYSTETEDVELLFSPSTVYVGIEGRDLEIPVIVVREDDRVVRLINSMYVKNVKVTSFSE